MERNYRLCTNAECEVSIFYHCHFRFFHFCLQIMCREMSYGFCFKNLLKPRTRDRRTSGYYHLIVVYDLSLDWISRFCPTNNSTRAPITCLVVSRYQKRRVRFGILFINCCTPSSLRSHPNGWVAAISCFVRLYSMIMRHRNRDYFWDQGQSSPSTPKGAFTESALRAGED